MSCCKYVYFCVSDFNRPFIEILSWRATLLERLGVQLTVRLCLWSKKVDGLTGSEHFTFM